MEGDLIRIPKPWDDDLKNLTVTERNKTESFKDTGVSSSFIRRPETPTWKKPETTGQNLSRQTQ